jgi:hypothetical protein
MARFDLASTRNTGTGPYRRIWSDSPMSAAQATVYLPSLAKGDIVSANGDTAFIYLGGWGSAGQALDAGLMHNPGTDTWSLFIKYQGLAENLGGTPQVRLKPDQTVTVTFSIPDDGSVKVETSGQAVQVVDAANQTDLGVQSLAVQQNGLSGFPSDGTDVILKRMTSIAQNHENFQSGSKISGVAWTNVQCGTDPGSLSPWTITDPAGTLIYDKTVVSVNYVSDHEETVSITL